MVAPTLFCCCNFYLEGRFYVSLSRTRSWSRLKFWVRQMTNASDPRLKIKAGFPPYFPSKLHQMTQHPILHFTGSADIFSRVHPSQSAAWGTTGQAEPREEHRKMNWANHPLLFSSVALVYLLCLKQANKQQNKETSQEEFYFQVRKQNREL